MSRTFDAMKWNAIYMPTTGRGYYNILWYHVKISVLPRLSEQLYISSDWLVEVVWSRHCFILERKVQFYPSNFLDCTNFQPQIRIMKSTAPFSIQQTFFWQHNSLLALLWGECPIIYTQHLMRLYLLYSHIFTVFKAFRVMIDFDKCYRYLFLCIDMIPTLWSIMSQILLDCWID